MIWLVALIGALAVYHLAVESVIAPSCRDAFRYRLFSARDRLRALRIDESPGLDDDAFRVMESIINNAIALLTRLDLITMHEYERELRHHPSLQKRLDKRKAVVRGCRNVEAVSIMREVDKTVLHAVIVNMAGWVVYVVPIAVIWLMIDRVRTVLMVPESEIQSVVPADAANDCA